MQTTSRDDSMMSDFFQIDGYTNIAGTNSNLIKNIGKGGIMNTERFTTYARRGNGKGFDKLFFRAYAKVYAELKQDFELSDTRINELWVLHTTEGGKIKGFKDFVSKIERSKVQEQIVNEENTLPTMDTVDVSDVDLTEKKSGVSLLYVGLGAVALVGITILIVKKF